MPRGLTYLGKPTRADTVRRVKTASAVLGVLLVISGSVWFLQGIDVLKGSGMSGQTTWAVIGPFTVVIGLALIAYGLKRSRSDSGPAD